MEKATINIKTFQSDGVSPEEEILNIVTDGGYSFKDGALYLSYKESAISGMEGTTTVLKIDNDGFVMKRVGNLFSKMQFVPGKRSKSVMHTPHGNLNIEILTGKIDKKISEYPFSLDMNVNYDISVSNNFFVGRNRIVITAEGD